MMPFTRGRVSSMCKKRAREEPASVLCDDCSHLTMIAHMKREIVELRKSLDVEREQRLEAERERFALNTVHKSHRTKPTTVKAHGTESETDEPEVSVAEVHEQTVYELELCKKELESTRDALEEACVEREALRAKLSEKQTTGFHKPPGDVEATASAEESHPQLDWVGRHYLAVSLPSDIMFKPGEPVTPVAVLQKLFEMRVGEKLAQGFGLLLENINIMLSQMEPEWYAKHFGFCRAHTHGNKYKSTDRLDTEDFAWLLFEYRAHAPLIEVLAVLQNVLSSTGKAGVTTAALSISRNMYSAYVTMFRDTVSGSSESFASLRQRALRVRKAAGNVFVPLAADLQEDQIKYQGSPSVRNRVLRSVLEPTEVPPHVSGTSACGGNGDVASRADPLGLGHSLSAFLKRPDSEGQTANRRRRGAVPFKTPVSSKEAGPLKRRVIFDAPFSDA